MRVTSKPCRNVIGQDFVLFIVRPCRVRTTVKIGGYAKDERHCDRCRKRSDQPLQFLRHSKHSASIKTPHGVFWFPNTTSNVATRGYPGCDSTCNEIADRSVNLALIFMIRYSPYRIKERKEFPDGIGFVGGQLQGREIEETIRHERAEPALRLRIERAAGIDHD